MLLALCVLGALGPWVPVVRAVSSCTAPSLLTSYSTGGVNGGTSGSWTASGDLWVGGISSFTSTSVAVSDSRNGGNWTCTTAQVTSGSNSAKLCYRFNQGGNSGLGTTVTLTGAATYPSIIIYGVTGSVTAGDPLDQNTGNKTDAGTTLAPGTITPGQADEILFTNLASGVSANADMQVSGDGFTKLSGFSQVGGVNIAGAIASVIQTTASATSSVQWTSTTSSVGLSASIASFKCLSVSSSSPRLLGLLGVGR